MFVRVPRPLDYSLGCVAYRSVGDLYRVFGLTLYRQGLIQGVRFDTVRQGLIQGVRFDTVQTGTYTECSV